MNKSPDRKLPTWCEIKSRRNSRFTDESDRHGIRVVIEVRQDANVNVVVNKLFKHTQMEKLWYQYVSFGTRSAYGAGNKNMLKSMSSVRML